VLTILLVLVPVIPGLFWMWVFYQTDRYEPEPKHLILATFALGVVSIAPAWLIEQGAGLVYPFMEHVEAAAEGSPLDGNLVPIFLGCFLVIGPAEELCKFLAVRLFVYRHAEFDEPLDGLIYAAASALGFASLENVLYVVHLRHHALEVEWTTLAARSLMALPGHVIFAATWGYGLGRKKFDRRFPLWATLVGAAALHGTYDFVLMVPPLRPLCLLFMGVMVPVMVRQIRALRRDSPFKPGGPRAAEVAPYTPRAAPRPQGMPAGLLTACVRCAVLSRWEDSYCLVCGEALDKRKPVCGRCRKPIEQAADPYCRSCGSAIWPV
jgi:RsiW-degrading membrane proteinase PrsW (M82 family)